MKLFMQAAAILLFCLLVTHLLLFCTTLKKMKWNRQATTLLINSSFICDYFNPKLFDKIINCPQKYHRSNIDRLGYFRSDGWGHKLLQRRVKHRWKGKQGSCAIFSRLQKVRKPKPDSWERVCWSIVVKGWWKNFEVIQPWQLFFSSSEFLSYLNFPGQTNLCGLWGVCVLEVLSEPNSDFDSSFNSARRQW